MLPQVHASSIGRLVLAAIVSAVIVTGGQSSSSGGSTPQPVPKPPLSSLTLIETEVVTIHGMTADPATITRPAGKFFLLLINKTHAPVSLTFDSPSLAATALGPLTQALNFGALQSQSVRRVAGAFDAPAGTYNIRSAAGGTVLCTITLQ
jgi:hypothetical protein